MTAPVSREMPSASESAAIRLAVLVASYNRADTTVRGLASLRTALDATPNMEASIFLVDDASTDGTAKRVRGCFPDIEVIDGTGQLFWTGAMCAGFSVARSRQCFDAYLLFNDDVELASEQTKAFLNEFAALNAQIPTIVVGPLTGVSGELTYGGLVTKSPLRPLTFSPVTPNGQLQQVDTFHGNCVAVPGWFFEKIGGLDPTYRHGYADLDLGLVARRNGIDVVLWRDSLGTCERGPSLPERLRAHTIAKRVLLSISGKNALWQDLYFCWKHKPLSLLIPFAIVSFVKRITMAITAPHGQRGMQRVDDR